MMGAHDALTKLKLSNLAACRHLNVSKDTEPVHARIKRTSSVGEFLRQHRNHTAREINRGTARFCLLIQWRARRDVVGNISNSDQQAPTTTLARLNINRVIKVARILAINSDQWQVA